MGCIVTKEEEIKNTKGSGGKNDNKYKDDPSSKKNDDTAKKNDNNNTSNAAGGASGADDKGGKGDELQGRFKFIVDIGAAVMTVGERTSIASLFLLSCPRNSKHGIFLTYLNAKDNKLYVAEVSDEELGKQKIAQNISHQYSALFKSMTTDTLKGKVKVSESSEHATAEFNIVSVKDKTKLPFKLTLNNVALSNENRHKFLLEPMSRMVQMRRKATEEREKEIRTSRLQTQLQLQEFSITIHRANIDRLKPKMGSLREEAALFAKLSSDLSTQIGRVERKIKLIERGTTRNELDDMYEKGGARSFAHLPQGETHLPQPATQLATSSNAEFIGQAINNVKEPSTLPQVISEPRLKALYDNCTESEISGIVQCMTKLDEWDYSVFEVEKATGGNALFFTTYAILCKLDLINHLQIPDSKLRNFLLQVQAGYHPNPYHNSTHAADVTQINYFILHKGGLAEKCKLSKEELFGSIISGAIHDYDHPGFNNSFHSRTNAYLSTLYNDRSILENHHLACVFELMRKSEFNLLGHMTDDQKKEIRETMCETVLSTDMGLHGKIFGTFRRRLTDAPDWSASKDDIRLALSMSIKMADTSNCGRPNHLYVEWAKNIANEFYHQGDVEAQLCLPISPYMDRRKEKEEFPKGQVFFMNVVVLGMFEKMAELLPPLDVAVRHCSENKDYWQQIDS